MIAISDLNLSGSKLGDVEGKEIAETIIQKIEKISLTCNGKNKNVSMVFGENATAKMWSVADISHCDHIIYDNQSIPKEIITSQRLKKSVRFQECVRIVLIPSRLDYKAAKVTPLLWWTSSDYPLFQRSAWNEISLLSSLEGIDFTTAKSRLYGLESITSEDKVLHTSEYPHTENLQPPKTRSISNLPSLEDDHEECDIDAANVLTSLMLTLCVPLRDSFPLIGYHSSRSSKTNKRNSDSSARPKQEETFISKLESFGGLIFTLFLVGLAYNVKV